MDRGTIRSRAKKQLNEPSGTNEGFWTDAQYNNAITDAEVDFVLQTKCLATYAEMSTDGTNAEFNMDEDSLANFLKIKEVWFFESSTIYRKLRSVGRDELMYIQGEIRGVTTYPEVYCYEDRVIEFDTVPQSGYTIRIYYYKLPTAMTDDADVSNVPVKFHQSLVDYVCWKFNEADDLNATSAMYFKNEYYEGIIKARNIIEPEGEAYEYIKDDGSEADLYA